MDDFTFLVNRFDQKAVELHDQFVKTYGAAPLNSGKPIVAIGGDGILLEAVNIANGVPVLGLVAPGSSSVGYTLNRYEPGRDLHEIFAEAIACPITPITADITYDNGESRRLVSISGFNLNMEDGQAMNIKLTGVFQGVARTIDKVGGDGIIFSTPLGSTGQNFSNRGPALLVEGPALIMNPHGLYTPLDFGPIVSLDPADYYDIECLSPEKRPLKIDVDGASEHPTKAKHFARLHVALAGKPAAILMMQPGSLHPFKRWQP